MATQYKPILFSTEMVQAILAGRKTQTRRIIKPQPEQSNVILDGIKQNVFMLKDCATPNGWLQHKLHDFKIGDILWVRETFVSIIHLDGSIQYYYKAGKNWAFKIFWKPSIHMPKEAARIFLEVSNVRVERLQDISEDDAIAEGIERVSIAPFVHRFKNYLCNNKFIGPKESFKTLWMKINGIDSWKANPWVWVYEFKQVHHPKGFLNED